MPIGEDPAAHGHWCTFTDLYHAIPFHVLIMYLHVRGIVRSYLQGVVIYKKKLSGVAPRKRETTNVGSARLSGAFFALSNDASQAMVGVGKPLSHDHLRTEVLFWIQLSPRIISSTGILFFVAQLFLHQIAVWNKWGMFWTSGDTSKKRLFSNLIFKGDWPCSDINYSVCK